MEATKGGVIARTHAEEVLELPKILRSLSKFCSTQPGKTKAENLSPLKDQFAVEAELERVEAIRRSGESADFFAPFGPGCLRERVESADHITIDELVAVRRFLGSSDALKARFAHGRLKDFFAGLHDFRDLIAQIDKRIDESGVVRDDASPRLAQLRVQQRQINRRLRDVLNGMLRDNPGMFTDLNIVERSGHFVLPVRSNFKKQVKGIIHSFSNSGETVFIEPMVVSEDAALLAELEEGERIEIEAILRELTDSLRGNIDEIEEDIDRIVTLDVLFAKVHFANELGAHRPAFDQSLSVLNAFHPVLRHINDHVVPLNLRLNSGKRVLLISGPNAGGKTVVLKTVGVVALMAKCGLFIPAAEGSSLPFFDEVYADIGDEQSIESQLSTFAGHIKQIKTALEGESNSLVLLDELMSQTSVEEGSALASAILDELSSKGKFVLATTHNENLKIFVSNRGDMVNGGMEYSDRPTYRLILGVPQPSNAIRLARTLGISETVLDRANAQLDDTKVSVNRLFEDLSKELKRVEEERKKLSALASDYEGKVAAFNIKKKQEFDELKSKYRNELRKAKKEVERLIKVLREEGPKPDSVRKARDFFEAELRDEPAGEAYHPGVGELVRIRELRRIGQVVAQKGSKYKISLQNIYYWVDPTDIESIREDKGNQN